MSQGSKFLVLNPNEDNLESVLEKANLQNKKNGPFEALFLLGDVIPENHSVPQTEISQPTYFTRGHKDVSETIGSTEDSDFVDVKPNLAYGSSLVNVLKLKSGLVVMLIAGIAEQAENHDELHKLIKEHKLAIDILITYNWPQAIAQQEKLSLVGAKVIDEIVIAIKPRYHFCVGHKHGKFFENKPFEWDTGVTRFISLGQEGSGEKWFYAFSMSLEKSDPISTGENPFTKPAIEETVKRPLEDVEVLVVKKPKVVSPESCYFCLSNPNVETHMIVSIGSHAYLTVAKGPLTRSNKNLPFSGHAIIIPVEHIPTLRSADSDVISSPIYKEIQKYQSTLVKAFASQKPELRLVFYEVCRSTNVHQHTQVVPIANHLVDKFDGAVHEKAKLNNERYERNHPLNFKTFTDDTDPEYVRIINSSDYVLFVVYHSESSKTIYLCELEDSAKGVDFQFPRRVLAYTLNLPKRVYWERCQQPKLKETSDCEEFKKFYKEYDFTT